MVEIWADKKTWAILEVMARDGPVSKWGLATTRLATHLKEGKTPYSWPLVHKVLKRLQKSDLVRVSGEGKGSKHITKLYDMTSYGIATWAFLHLMFSSEQLALDYFDDEKHGRAKLHYGKNGHVISSMRDEYRVIVGLLDYAYWLERIGGNFMDSVGQRFLDQLPTFRKDIPSYFALSEVIIDLALEKVLQPFTVKGLSLSKADSILIATDTVKSMVELEKPSILKVHPLVRPLVYLAVRRRLLKTSLNKAILEAIGRGHLGTGKEILETTQEANKWALAFHIPVFWSESSWIPPKKWKFDDRVLLMHLLGASRVAPKETPQEMRDWIKEEKSTTSPFAHFRYQRALNEKTGFFEVKSTLEEELEGAAKKRYLLREKEKLTSKPRQSKRRADRIC